MEGWTLHTQANVRGAYKSRSGWTAGLSEIGAGSQHARVYFSLTADSRPIQEIYFCRHKDFLLCGPRRFIVFRNWILFLLRSYVLMYYCVY